MPATRATGTRGRYGLRDLYQGPAPAGRAPGAYRAAGRDLLAPAQYAALRDATLALIARHPSGSVLIGVGRTSSAVTAMLDALDAEADYLPIDGLASDVGLNPEAFFDAAFDKHLPPAGALAGKTIVLHQITPNGRLLRRTENQLARYLAARGVAAQVTSVALSPSSEPSPHIFDTSTLAPLHDLGSDGVAAAIGFIGHRVLGPGRSVGSRREQARPGFVTFREHLEAHMAHDDVLAQALRRR